MTAVFPRGQAANPFAASRVAPHRAEFVFPEGESAAALLDRFAAAGFRGEIAAPHGHGKTTLLWALAREAARRGHRVTLIRLGESGRPSLHHLESDGTCGPILFLDVARIAPAVAALLRLMPWRRALLTAHRPTGFGHSYRLSVSAEAFGAFVGKLIGEPQFGDWVEIGKKYLEDAGGNSRQALDILYGKWEQSDRVPKP